MSDDFHDVLIAALYKNKGSKSDFRNYRDISLLSIAGKTFARIFLNRLLIVSERNSQRQKVAFGHKEVEQT